MTWAFVVADLFLPETGSYDIHRHILPKLIVEILFVLSCHQWQHAAHTDGWSVISTPVEFYMQLL